MCKHGPTGVSLVPCRVSCSPHPLSGDFLYVVSLQICYNPVIPVQSEWGLGLFTNLFKKKKRRVWLHGVLVAGLQSSLQRSGPAAAATGPLAVACDLSVAAHGIEFPDQVLYGLP